MKVVKSENEFDTYLTAKSEAKKFLLMMNLYIESFLKTLGILKFKHYLVKIELFIYMKEIVVQRRHQKLIEETLSPVLNDTLRNDLFDKTVKMVSKIGYEGAKVEYIYENGKFYFWK